MASTAAATRKRLLISLAPTTNGTDTRRPLRINSVTTTPNGYCSLRKFSLEIYRPEAQT